MYYDPITEEQSSISELSKIYNTSFPRDIEVVDDKWYLLHYQDAPIPSVKEEVRSGGIQLIDGKYWQTYILVDRKIDDVCRDVEERFSNDVSERLNNFAEQRGYDGIATACSYSTSSVPQYKSEGEKAIQARDLTWSKFFEVLNKEIEAYRSGERDVPTWNEIESELPTLSWD